MNTANCICCNSVRTCLCSSLFTIISWWHHKMETFSALLAICVGNSPVTGEFPTQRPVRRSFDVSFDLHLKKGWVNNREAGDLRCHHAHYDITVMYPSWYVNMYASLIWGSLANVFFSKVIVIWWKFFAIYETKFNYSKAKFPLNLNCQQKPIS